MGTTFRSMSPWHQGSPLGKLASAYLSLPEARLSTNGGLAQPRARRLDQDLPRCRDVLLVEAVAKRARPDSRGLHHSVTGLSKEVLARAHRTRATSGTESD